MTRFLLTGDWQADLKNLDRCEMAVQEILKHLRHPCGTYFIHLGDAKNVMNPVDQRVTNFLISAFSRIKEASLGMFYVRGNHDQIHVHDDSENCVPVFEAVGFDVIADGSWKTWSAPLREASGAHLWMVPYFRDRKRQTDAFYGALNARKQHSSGTHILLFHNEVEGCFLNATRKGSGITADQMGASAYDICIGGHIHKPQSVPPNIHFCGSPFSVDWSECNQEKRYMVIEV